MEFIFWRRGSKNAEDSLICHLPSQGDTEGWADGEHFSVEWGMFTMLTQIEIGGIFPVYSVT